MNILLQMIRTADLSVYHFLNGLAGNWFFDRLASHAEGNQFLKGGFFLAFYWYHWFGAAPDRKKRRKAIVVIVFAAVLAVLLARTIAFATPFRTRPAFDPIVQHYRSSLPVSADFENWSSFPSDNAAFFFALACGIAYLARRLAIPIMLYTAGWTCLPRMYFGIHYASDIVAGAAIGIAVVWFALRTEWLWTGLASRVLSAVDASPPVFYAAAFLVSFEMARMFGDIRDEARAVIRIARVAPHAEVGGAVLIAFTVLTLSVIAAHTAARRHGWPHRVSPSQELSASGEPSEGLYRPAR